MTDITTIAAGLTLARKLLNEDRAAFVKCHTAPKAGLAADDQAIADDYTAAIASITDAAAQIQRLRADCTTLAWQLNGIRSSREWHASRLRQLQIVQTRMRDPERTMVCDILANGTLLEPDGSRYSITDTAAPITAVADATAEHAQRLTLQHHAADLAQRVAELEAERGALAARLAEIERTEPVAWIEHELQGTGARHLHFERRPYCLRDDVIAPVWTALIARPEPGASPQPPVAEPARQPLTDEQIERLFKAVDSADMGRFAIVRGFARAIERAHGIGQPAGNGGVL